MNFGKCALCLNAKDLCESHILPNGVFKKLKRSQSSGQLIKFDDKPDTPVSLSQDSWWEFLLCLDCEGIIKKYETYGLNFFRGDVAAKHYKVSTGISFQGHKYSQLKNFLLSLLWRAAVSEQKVFSSVPLPREMLEPARASLYSGRALSPSKFGVRITRMVDRTGAEGAFTPATLKKLIISPIRRTSESANLISFLFLLEGFLLEYFVPAVPFRLKDASGVHRDSSVLFTPYQCIFTVPELVRIFASTYGKHARGLVNSDRSKPRDEKPVPLSDV